MAREIWPDVPIADLQAPKRWALNGGPFGSKLVSRDYVDDGVPVIRGTNLPSDRRFSHDDLVFVSEDKADELMANNAHPGDVVFTQRGTLGQVGIIPMNSPYRRFVISQSQMKLTVDESRVDADWLFYCFKNPTTQQEMINRASSSGVPHINLGVLREFRIRLPSLLEQRRIASILCTYDDLIENNTRRIAILEEMARRIYEEWFVRFRFPGFEAVRMVESELGLVPEGWRLRALGDLVDDVRDGVNPDAVAPETPYVGLEHIPRRSIALADWGHAADVGSTKLRFLEGDILFGKIRPYFHKVAVAPVAGVTSSDAIVIRAKQAQDFGLALAVASSDAFVAHATQTSNGTKMPRANWGVLRQYPVLTPPRGLHTRFELFMAGVVSAVSNHVLRNRNLRATRDLLLPKLISGELDVSKLPEPETVAA
jgi:type I restriction enzyme, S subunit